MGEFEVVQHKQYLIEDQLCQLDELEKDEVLT